ncbi:MAG: imidazolonepropionase [Raineya sp.]
MEEFVLGTFKQALSLRNLPLKGSIKDENLELIQEAGVWLKNGKIFAIDTFEKLTKRALEVGVEIIELPKQNAWVLSPSFVDCHTHICFGGNRAQDYALRIAGESYLNIAKMGGGILDSVRKTRLASEDELCSTMLKRLNQMLSQGVTTAEIKTGYGLSVEQELKMLHSIERVSLQTPIDIVPTCLAAHTLAPEFSDKQAYLNYILQELLPIIQKEKFCKRIDIFVEETAFSYALAKPYLQAAKNMGFEITIHADQFSTDGSKLAVEMGAISADHLEASTDKEIEILAKSNTIAVVLPGASLGLGMAFAPARKLLDAGACLAISTDWNPGSAPMGNLLLQASVLAAGQKLSSAETWAAITFRAAQALNLNDRGRLQEGYWADMLAFDCHDYREILYWQGQMLPQLVWKNGLLV